MDHVCTCESVLQPRHESYYFHVKVVLVAQNSCTESAKLTYIFKNAGDFLRRKRRSYALSDTCFSVTGTDHPCPASYGLVSDSRWIFANDLAQDGIKPHETRMNVARAVETPCGREQKASGRIPSWLLDKIGRTPHALSFQAEYTSSRQQGNAWRLAKISKVVGAPPITRHMKGMLPCQQNRTK
jgi:hypothetical protein